MGDVKDQRDYTAAEVASRMRHLADRAVPGAAWIHGSASKLFRRAADLLDARTARWLPIKDAPITFPVIVGCKGEKRVALAWYHGLRWRHAESLEPVCFEPTHFQYLPDPVDI